MTSETKTNQAINTGPTPPTVPWSDHTYRLIDRWTLVLLVAAVLWRLIRFGLKMPMWGDEAMLDLNIMDRSLGQMLRPLGFGQVAPPLFLLGEWLMQHHLGNSEYVLRLLPLLAGIASCFIFWRWSRMLLSPLGTLIAVGFFALGYYPVRHCVEVKPYALDELAALCLYFLGTAWIINPQRTRYLWAAAIITPLLLGISYPSVFVAGGLCVAVAAELTKNRRWDNLLAGVLLAAATVGGFLAVLKLAGAGQYHRTGAAMRVYWHHSFPPGNPLHFFIWFIRIHTGNLFAYPVGGKRGGSTATFLAFLVGLAVFIRYRRKFLLLLLTPFALTFIAAVLRRYPYGGSARVAQHLAPVICLLAGAGIAWLVEKFLLLQSQHRLATHVAGGLLLTVAVIGALRDVLHPYKTPADEKTRSIVVHVLQQTRDSGGLVVLQPMNKVPVNFQLYLRWYGRHIFWNGWRATDWASRPGQRIVVLNFKAHLSPRLLLAKVPHNVPWRIAGQKTWHVQIGPIQYGPTFCQVIELHKR